MSCDCRKMPEDLLPNITKPLFWFGDQVELGHPIELRGIVYGIKFDPEGKTVDPSTGSEGHIGSGWVYYVRLEDPAATPWEFYLWEIEENELKLNEN